MKRGTTEDLFESFILVGMLGEGAGKYSVPIEVLTKIEVLRCVCVCVSGREREIASKRVKRAQCLDHPVCWAE